MDKREYGGALWEQIENAFQFVLRNIHLGARLEGLYRQDIYELPPDSIRELIINAVMNCSFLQNSHIQVAVYDDRLEITSPGGLMPGVTLERMKEGYSKIRNRALAHAFSYMNLIEAWGSGIPKLMMAMEDYGLQEPEFVEMGIAFRVNLYRSQGDTKTNQATNQGSQKTNRDAKMTNQGAKQANQAVKRTAGKLNQKNIFLKNEEKQLVQLVADKPAITQMEMAGQLGWSLGKVKHYITKLKKNQVLERVGTSQKGHWNRSQKRWDILIAILFLPVYYVWNMELVLMKWERSWLLSTRF